MFVMNSCDFNQNTLNSSSAFPNLLQFGPLSKNLQRLSSKLEFIIFIL